MTKVEKIKEQLKVCIKGKCPQDCEFLPVDNCWMALVGELLKEQEPVKPSKLQGKWFKTWHCGACGSFIGEVNGNKVNYCGNCGKAVKWE